MADSFSLSVDGFDDITSRLLSLSASENRAVNKALNEAGGVVADAMRENVSVSTVEHVHIKDDIEVSKVKGAGADKYVQVGPGKETNWRAKFIEFGTSKMPAQPFMEPAALQSRDKVKQTIASALREALHL